MITRLVNATVQEFAEATSYNREKVHPTYLPTPKIGWSSSRTILINLIKALNHKKKHNPTLIKRKSIYQTYNTKQNNALVNY